MMAPVCGNHRAAFYDHRFVLVPCLQDFEKILEYEENDMDNRLRTMQDGQRDPGRNATDPKVGTRVS